MAEPSGRILIVEDDADMAAMLVQAMRESGYESDSAPDGEAGLQAAPGFDVVVADVMMPSMNGLEMTSALRDGGHRVPVILVTARDSTADIVKGLDAGADDYLVKPFKLDELLARVRSNLRRAAALTGIRRWHDFELDLENRHARRDGRSLSLSSTEFALLHYFIARPGQVISKVELLAEVWHDDGSRNENLVEIYINYLRKKTETFGAARVIRTIRGSGYVLATTGDES